MIASAALRSRWWTGSVRVWTGATTIESPVWTPSGSTFSIEQTAMHVSSASRMTSYSISCQPTRQRSTMTWPIGLARKPGADPLAVGGLGLDDAAAGPAEREGRPDDRRQADRRRAPRRPRRRAAPAVAPSTMKLGAYGWPIRSSRSRNASRSSAIPIASSGVPRRRIAWRSKTPGVGHRGHQVERGLAAEPGEQALGLLLGDDRLDRLDGQRLEVDDVGDRGVGHDRGRVRVDEDRPDALGAQRAAGLRPGVVELGRLADDDRPGPEDQDRRRLADRVRVNGRAPRRRRGRHEPVEHGQRVERAGRALGVVLDGLDRLLAVAQALDRAVVEVDLADPEARRGRQRVADDLDLVVLGRHLDEAHLEVAGPGGSRRGGRTAAGACRRRRPGPRSGGRGRSRAAAGRRR